MAEIANEPPANWEFNYYHNAHQLISLSYATISAANGYIAPEEIDKDEKDNKLHGQRKELYGILKKEIFAKIPTDKTLAATHFFLSPPNKQKELIENAKERLEKIGISVENVEKATALLSKVHKEAFNTKNLPESDPYELIERATYPNFSDVDYKTILAISTPFYDAKKYPSELLKLNDEELKNLVMNEMLQAAKDKLKESRKEEGKKLTQQDEKNIEELLERTVKIIKNKGIDASSIDNDSLLKLSASGFVKRIASEKFPDMNPEVVRAVSDVAYWIPYDRAPRDKKKLSKIYNPDESLKDLLGYAKKDIDSLMDEMEGKSRLEIRQAIHKNDDDMKMLLGELKVALVEAANDMGRKPTSMSNTPSHIVQEVTKAATPDASIVAGKTVQLLMDGNNFGGYIQGAMGLNKEEAEAFISQKLKTPTPFSKHGIGSMVALAKAYHNNPQHINTITGNFFENHENLEEMKTALAEACKTIIAEHPELMKSATNKHGKS